MRGSGSLNEGSPVKPVAQDPALGLELDAVEDAVIRHRGLVDPPGLEQLDLREAGFIGPQGEGLAVGVEVDATHGMGNTPPHPPRSRGGILSPTSWRQGLVLYIFTRSSVVKPAAVVKRWVTWSAR